MEELDNSRIIASCLEINNDIIMMKLDSKLPLLLSKIRESYYRNKLIKTVNKLQKANIPLNTDNLTELFIYIYSNYPPYGIYKEIKWCKCINVNSVDIIESCIVLDDMKAIFKIDKLDTSGKFRLILSIKKDEKFYNYDILLSELITSNNMIKDYVKELNKLLINIMRNYILDTINSYKVERKRNTK